MFGTIALSARLAARRAAFGLVSTLLLLVGFAFFTAAAFMAMQAARGAIFAALVVGAAYTGLALILLAIGMRRPLPPPVAAPPVAAVSLAGIAGAFVQGIGAGIAARAAAPRRPPPPPPPV